VGCRVSFIVLKGFNRNNWSRNEDLLGVVGGWAVAPGLFTCSRGTLRSSNPRSDALTGSSSSPCRAAPDCRCRNVSSRASGGKEKNCSPSWLFCCPPSSWASNSGSTVGFLMG